MDTLLNLPQELLGKIEFLFNLPNIRVVQQFGCGSEVSYYFCIYYRTVTIRLQMTGANSSGMLDQFINIGSFYIEIDDDGNEFTIDCDSKSISISSKLTEVYLPLDSKDQVISTMKIYREMLNSVAKNYICKYNFFNILPYSPPETVLPQCRASHSP